jgi:hypothetical protein
VLAAVADWIIAAGVIGSAVGGIGFALGAGARAAWKAAGASLEASKQSRYALAFALRPDMQLEINQWGPHSTIPGVMAPPSARAWVLGDWPAVNVLVEVRLVSGRAASRSVQLLENVQWGPGTHGARYGSDLPRLEVPIAEADDDWPPPGGDHVTASVTFSDVRRVSEYRLAMEADLHRPAGGGRGLVSFQNVTEPSLQQLS